MKKLATFVFALLLTASLSFAQAAPAAGTTAPADTSKTGDTSKKGHKGGKKGHKGAKKGKKTDKGADTAAAPK